MYAIGIDLGGTSIKYALIGKDGSFLFSGKLPSYADVSADAVIAQLLEAVRCLREFSLSNGYALKGIGIGTPGIVDDSNRIVLGGAENIKGWENINLADSIEKATSLPCVVSNDANLMGLGETHYGAGKGASHVVFLTVGTGIGGAVIINNQLFNGYANRGTELGHTPLIVNGEPCACGSVGCLEHYASTTAMVRNFIRYCKESGRRVDERDVNGEQIISLYKQGDEMAVKSFDEHCLYLGHGIAGFINIFSPQRIIIGGGLSEAGEFYINKLSENAFRFCMKDCAVNTTIMAASLGNKAGSMGAAWLVFNS